MYVWHGSFGIAAIVITTNGYCKLGSLAIVTFSNDFNVSAEETKKKNVFTDTHTQMQNINRNQ